MPRAISVPMSFLPEVSGKRSLLGAFLGGLHPEWSFSWKSVSQSGLLQQKWRGVLGHGSLELCWPGEGPVFCVQCWEATAAGIFRESDFLQNRVWTESGCLTQKCQLLTENCQIADLENLVFFFLFGGFFFFIFSSFLHVYLICERRRLL